MNTSWRLWNDAHGYNLVATEFKVRKNRCKMFYCCTTEAHHAAKRVPKAQFAFLSACHVAIVSEKIPEETMNITAGHRFARFARVVGTLWEVADADAMQIASSVYEHLSQHDMNIADAAYSLKKSFAELRKSNGPVDRWATFIYYGV